MSALEDSLAVKEPVRIYRSLDLFWARLAVHIRAEHLVIFPAIRENTKTMNDHKPYMEESFERLRSDHDFFIKQLARAIKAMRLVPEFGNEVEIIEVVCGLVDSIKQRLAEHDRFEEDHIYPMVYGGAGDPDSIAARTLKELENLPPRLRNTV